MPDTYKFRVPINFEIEIPGGVENPDWRPQLIKEIRKVIHTFVRAAPDDVLFDYPAVIEDTVVRFKSYVGKISTSQVPSRFKVTDIRKWSAITSEIHRRSMPEKDPSTGKIHRKADIPFPVGRYASMIHHWMHKYGFVQHKQMEMLEFWAKKYKTKAQPPTLTTDKIAKTKADKKVLKKVFSGWKALKVNDAVPSPEDW